MDFLNVFTDLLCGNDEELIKKCMEQDNIKRNIELGSNISAIMHILVESKITTEERISEVREMYKKELEKNQIEVIKKELKEYKKGDKNE